MDKKKTGGLSWTHILLIALAVGVATAALVLSNSNPFKTPEATVPLPTIGKPAKMDLALAAGSPLSFAVYAEKAHSGQKPRDSLWLHIELFQGDKRVLETKCVGIDGQRQKTGTQVGVTFWGGDGCKITVPEPGTQAIQATVYFPKDGAGLTLEGLALKVFIDEH
ncbi:MAG: hypothetical protein JRI68_02330 [Deltaproteobacteria bacterium]|nr:hypothetical protein [Deltaproteobacteria bacterium]